MFNKINLVKFYYSRVYFATGGLISNQHKKIYYSHFDLNVCFNVPHTNTNRKRHGYCLNCFALECFA